MHPKQGSLLLSLCSLSLPPPRGPGLLAQDRSQLPLGGSEFPVPGGTEAGPEVPQLGQGRGSHLLLSLPPQEPTLTPFTLNHATEEWRLQWFCSTSWDEETPFSLVGDQAAGCHQGPLHTFSGLG